MNELRSLDVMDFPNAIGGPRLVEVEKCRVSARYFIESFCKIIDQTTGKVVPFIGYPHQKKLWDALTEAHLNRHEAILMHVVLKARQVGFTWALAVFALWKALFFRNEHIVFVSEKDLLAKEIMERVNFMYSNLELERPVHEYSKNTESDYWLKLSTLSNNSEMIHFGIKMRGGAINVKKSSNSRIQSIPTTATGVQSKTCTMVVVDESASVVGIKSIWHRSAKPALERASGIGVIVSTMKPSHHAQGAGKFFADLWRAANMRGTKSWNGFMAHFCPALTIPGRDMEWYNKLFDEGMPEEIVRHEYPLTESDAFAATGRNVFDLEVLQKRKEHLLKKQASFRRGFVNDDDFQDSKKGNIRLWKEPQKGHRYTVGVDASSGVSRDFTCVKVYDCDTGEEVAEAHGRIKPVPCAWIANWLGLHYNTALMTVEIEMHGLKVQEELMDKHDYPYVYQRRKFNKYQGQWEDNYGWKTTKTTRPKLLDDLTHNVNSGDYIIYSIQTIDEMMDFEENDEGRADHAAGGYSDRIFASALAYQGSLYGQADLAGKPVSPTEENEKYKSYKELMSHDGSNDWRYI